MHGYNHLYTVLNSNLQAGHHFPYMLYSLIILVRDSIQYIQTHIHVHSHTHTLEHPYGIIQHHTMYNILPIMSKLLLKVT